MALIDGMEWINTNVLRPSVGRSGLLSFVLFGVVQLLYVRAVYRIATSDDRQIPAKGTVFSWYTGWP